MLDTQVKPTNIHTYIQNVFPHEKDRVVRLREEYERLHLEEKEMNEDQEGRNVTAKIKTQMQKNSKENWPQNRSMDTYLTVLKKIKI